ncbi:MAG: hypothetical protein ACKO7P_02105, partial [Bacteroidota bacterium]
MDIYEITLKKLKESEKFRLIEAKDNILYEAIGSLVGDTIHFEKYIDMFTVIEKSDTLDEESEEQLAALNVELNNTDDYKVSLKDEIEELCQEIMNLGPHVDSDSSIWKTGIPIQELHFYERESFRNMFKSFTDYIYYNEKRIFNEIIAFY